MAGNMPTFGRSERRPHSELKSQWTARREDLPECRRAEEGVRQIVVGAVGDVEHFSAQIQLTPPPVGEMFHEREVQVRVTGPSQRVTAAVAERPEGGR